MRKRLFFTVIAVLSLVLPNAAETSAASAERQPLAVVSVASYDQLIANIALAGNLSGRPRLAEGLEGTLMVLTQGKGLAGLDKERPWGIVIEANGSRPGGYAFLPVDDLVKFEEMIGCAQEPFQLRRNKILVRCLQIQRRNDLGNNLSPKRQRR